MAKPEIYLGKVYKPLDADHDLSRGQRSYLKEQGISKDQFNRMSPLDQHDWKDETKNPAYESMRNYKGR